MTFGLGIYYVDLVLSRRFLSELGEGAQSYFSWASRLCDFPQGIFVMALSTAALPSLATFAAKGEHEELAKTWAHGMRLALFVAIPCSVALVVLGEPIVVLLFQRGDFDALAAHQTARALAWQGGAIFTVAAVRQLVPAFHALGDTRTPVIVSALDLVAFIVLALALRGPFGHVGHQHGRRRLERRADGAPASSASSCASGPSAGASSRSSTRADRGRLAWSPARPRGARRGSSPGWAPAPSRARCPASPASLVFGALYFAVVWGLGSRELGELAGPIRRRLARRARRD